MKRTAKFWTFLLALFAVAAPPVYADGLTQGDLLFALDLAYIPSEIPPQGTSPWLTATFTNLDPIGTNNRVQLTMDAGNLATASTQSVGSWFFNVTDELPALGLLQFENLAGTQQATIVRGRDSLEAGGGRFFDLEFLFSGSLFGPGGTSAYIISSTEAIDALSFDFLSTNSLGLTNYYSAANIQGINGGLNSWIAAETSQKPGPGPGPTPIPEPATMILLGFGLAGLTIFGRIRFFA